MNIVVEIRHLSGIIPINETPPYPEPNHRVLGGDGGVELHRKHEPAIVVALSWLRSLRKLETSKG